MKCKIVEENKNTLEAFDCRFEQQEEINQQTKRNDIQNHTVRTDRKHNRKIEQCLREWKTAQSTQTYAL